MVWETIKLTCPSCGSEWRHSTEELERLVKASMVLKSRDAGVQMKRKSGPFYDRWLAAMEARGEVLRCKDCLGFFSYSAGSGYNFCGYKGETVNPGHFACFRRV